jgi:cell division protein FtsI/penicillin-binding protein 2
MQNEGTDVVRPVRRIRVFYAFLVICMTIFLVRLFYVQIIRYDHYKASALSDQLRQYEIPASRGRILAHSGNAGATLPLVLNQKLYVVYADPMFIKNPSKVASDLARITGGKAADYEDKINAAMKIKGNRYTILAKKVPEDQANRIAKLKTPGLGTQAREYRTYPQGVLAAQLLGFVNDDGKGSYGVEQALNKQLHGTAGELKAITDVHGVPLAASTGNILRPAVPGKDVTLTIDLPMQKQVEKILADSVQLTKAEGASAVVMDPNTGAVRAMANVPTYDPGKYFEVENGELFNNGTVTHSIEVGSIMKTLTTAAALDTGVVKPDTSYYDPASWTVNQFKITNIEEDGGPGQRTIADILNLSLNTGVVWELMQMGGGKINEKARETWYGYMHDRYRFGQLTGIEQGYESAGYVPKPHDTGAGIDLTYANTSFGQAMTATPLQMASALSATVNGGIYYQPRLVDGKPKVVRKGVVSGKVSSEIIPLMQYVVDKHYIKPPFDQNRYTVGGKTGTAQIAKQGGGYLENDFNGTYLGFVGGDRPEYVISVFIYKPKVIQGRYAGSGAAQPVFAQIGHMLINNSYVTAKN